MGEGFLLSTVELRVGKCVKIISSSIVINSSSVLCVNNEQFLLSLVNATAINKHLHNYYSFNTVLPRYNNSAPICAGNWLLEVWDQIV
jgi:hypothetical protein